jgi:hypothetical protein
VDRACPNFPHRAHAGNPVFLSVLVVLGLKFVVWISGTGEEEKLTGGVGGLFVCVWFTSKVMLSKEF